MTQDSCRLANGAGACSVTESVSPQRAEGLGTSTGLRTSVGATVPLLAGIESLFRSTSCASGQFCRALETIAFIMGDVLQAGIRCFGAFDSTRCHLNGEKLPDGCSRQQFTRQMELFKKSYKNQLVAGKYRSRLRVICATPIGKGAESGCWKRFLCCVCRSPR